jgi:single-strand DNA-binding protein
MINKAILQGRLVADPELRQTQSGVPVASFKIAWSEKYKDTETKCFLPCTAWRGTGEFVNKYFSKGQEIAVEGQLITRSFDDKEGNKRSVTELIVDKAHFCGSKSDSQKSPDIYAANQAPSGINTATGEVSDEALDQLAADGDLPF